MPMLSFRISDDLAARVDEAAAGNRSAWIKGLIEREVGVVTGSVQQGSEGGPGDSRRALIDQRTELLRRARI